MARRVRLDSRQPTAYDGAIRFWRARTPITDHEYKKLETAARARAFHVAGATTMDLVRQVWEALDTAVAKGQDFDEFKRQVGEQLEESWGGEDAARLATVYRTNLQTAYGAGRYAAQQDPAVRAVRPFLQFVATEDDRTTPECEAKDGTVLPADDPWWSRNQTPCHMNCRSDIISLDPEEANEAGISERGPDAPSAPGFGSPPSLDGWEPSADDYPEGLRGAARARGL